MKMNEILVIRSKEEEEDSKQLRCFEDNLKEEEGRLAN